MKLLETICIKYGDPQNLTYHQSRLDSSYRELFGGNCPFNLAEIIKSRAIAKSSRLKCSIIISKGEIEKVKLSDYSIPRTTSLKIVESEIEYSHKFGDRSELNHLKIANPSYDEILIAKDGLISDTSFTNVCFLKQGLWFTPAKPLLAGTKRQKLLDSNKLREIDIKPNEIREYESVSLINAMLDLGEITIPTHRIYS